MNVLSLFSGIGGLELGLERAGMTVVGQVEIDEFCRRVLAKHWPEVPRHDDVRTCVEWWRSKRRPPVHLVAGGFCCQPASSAGLKLGPEDERWLWPEFAAVVAALGPEWVVWENVSGLRTRGLDVVLRDLDHLGYVCRVGEISACEMGAPHPRARLLGVAHAIGEGRCPWRADRRGASSPRVEQQDGAEPAGGAWWAVEPAVGRVAYGVPGRVDRARALGNAVVPAVSEYIGRLILPFWEGGMTQPIEPGAAMGELRERIAQAIMAEDLLQDDRAKNEPDYCSVDARVDAVMSVLASWQSLMAVLNEHYPPEVFDGSSGEEGARIVTLTREVDRLRREVEFEAKGDGWTDLEYAIFAQPTCACVTDEQAAQLPPGFSRPVCAVHPGAWTQAEVGGIKERAAARLARLEPYIDGPVPRVTSSPVEEPYHYQDVEQTVLDVGGDPLSATPWADPEYKGGEPA